MSLLGLYLQEQLARLVMRRIVRRLTVGRLFTIVAFMTIGAALGGHVATHYGYQLLPHLWSNYRVLSVGHLAPLWLGSWGR